MKNLKTILLCSLILFTFYKVVFTINNKNYKKIDYINDTGKVRKIKKDKIYVKNFVLYTDKIFNIGDKISFKGEVSKPNINTNKNLFNYKNYLLSQKIDYIIKEPNINLLIKKKNFLKSRILKIDNKYMQTLLLGENKLDEDIYTSLTTNGINHIFAISGMHFSLISLILIFILNLIFKNNIISYTVTSILLIIYATLINPSASIIRSISLFVFIFINKMFKEPLKTIEILIIIAIFLLIKNPFIIYDIGFVYSFVISFFLIYLKPKNIIEVSFLAFLFSIPITVNSIHQINLISPILNVIFVPLMSFLLFPLSLITLIFPVLEPILNLVTNIFESLSILATKFSILINVKYFSLSIVLIYYLFLIKKKYKYSLLFLFFVSLNIYIYPRLTMIDVSQGDAFLLELPFKKGNILIDTGGNAFYDIQKSSTIPYLKSRGINKLDYLILTHGDTDHLGGANDVIEEFNPTNVITNSYDDNDLEKKINHNNILKFSRNILDVNGQKFYFLNRKHPKENNDSLIIYTELNKYKLLFMGDSTKEEEKEILDVYNLENIHILKVGHHGSNTSSSEYFINKIKPKIALISVGKNNIYNHPSDRVIKTLSNSNIFKTSEVGSVEIIFKNQLKILTAANRD